MLFVIFRPFFGLRVGGDFGVEDAKTGTEFGQTLLHPVAMAFQQLAAL
jgi:hypothetical protein